MTEQQMIQEIARRAELTLEAATRAYKAMQSITQLKANQTEKIYNGVSLPKVDHYCVYKLVTI